MSKGWFNEKYRHSLSARGIKTSFRGKSSFATLGIIKPMKISIEKLPSDSLRAILNDNYYWKEKGLNEYEIANQMRIIREELVSRGEPLELPEQKIPEVSLPGPDYFGIDLKEAIEEEKPGDWLEIPEEKQVSEPESSFETDFVDKDGWLEAKVKKQVKISPKRRKEFSDLSSEDLFEMLEKNLPEVREAQIRNELYLRGDIKPAPSLLDRIKSIKLFKK